MVISLWFKMLYNFENGRDIIQDRPCKGADNVGKPAAIFELKKGSSKART